MNCNNKKLIGLITGNTLQPGVFAPKGSLLHCGFVGSCKWPCGYWIRHSQFKFLDIQLVLEGELSVSHNDRTVQVPAGSGVIIPPGNTFLKVVSPGFVQKKHIGIGGPLCLHNLGMMSLDKMTVIPNLADEIFWEYFDRLFDMAKDNQLRNGRDFTALLFKMLLLLSEKVQNKDYPALLTAAVAFIEDHFMEDITVDDICCYCSCSRTTIQQLFKKYLDKTPIKYLTDTRMKVAGQLIGEKHYPIKEIAFMCGFNNPLYFSNVFNQHFGCYPREYRKKETDGILNR